MLAKGKQFLFLIKQTSRFSELSPVKVLSVITERNIYLKGKHPLSFDKWIFSNGQLVRDDRNIIAGL